MGAGASSQPLAPLSHTFGVHRLSRWIQLLLPLLDGGTVEDPGDDSGNASQSRASSSAWISRTFQKEELSAILTSTLASSLTETEVDNEEHIITSTVRQLVQHIMQNSQSVSLLTVLRKCSTLLQSEVESFHHTETGLGEHLRAAVTATSAENFRTAATIFSEISASCSANPELSSFQAEMQLLAAQAGCCASLGLLHHFLSTRSYIVGVDMDALSRGSPENEVDKPPVVLRQMSLPGIEAFDMCCAEVSRCMSFIETLDSQPCVLNETNPDDTVSFQSRVATLKGVSLQLVSLVAAIKSSHDTHVATLAAVDCEDSGEGPAFPRRSSSFCSEVHSSIHLKSDPQHAKDSETKAYTQASTAENISEQQARIEALLANLRETQSRTSDMIATTRSTIATTLGILDQKMSEAASLMESATKKVANIFPAVIGSANGTSGANSTATTISIRPTQKKVKSRWKRPSKKERLYAAKAKAQERQVPRAYLPEPEGAFCRIAPVALGDWLDEHEEKGQKFSSFVRGSMRAHPHAHVQVIELIPVGPFGGNAPCLQNLQRYCATFFGCQCRIGKTMKISSIAGTNAQCGDESQLQLICGRVFDAMNSRKHARDVLCRVAVTMADLTPGEGWNFVYGQARAMDGVGVFSFARYVDAGTWSIPYHGADATTGIYDDEVDRADAPSMGSRGKVSEDQDYRASILYRSAKVLTHETGHLFGIRHCIYYECLMAGCNHIQEFDQRPLHLCPIDLRKLQHASKFDVADRYRRLGALYEEFGWHAEAQWVAARIAAIEA